MPETLKWEYIVRTFGNALRQAKEADMEAALNELGGEGWEAVSAYVPASGNAVKVIFKRPLTGRTTRQHSFEAFPK